MGTPLQAKKIRVRIRKPKKSMNVRRKDLACSLDRPGKAFLKISQIFCHQGSFGGGR
jgi:hypothetical protein